jgi:hypothetical protein
VGTARARGLVAAPAAPALLGAAWVAALWGELALPGVALANRDIAGFHLPLRTCLVRLAALGWPLWNPWLTGGQPVLSNPNYAALYPPTWLAWALGPLYSLNWLVLIHGGIAFAGAWTLARRLGGGRAAAALAAIGYSGCGAYVSLLNAFTMFTSMAWFPWVLAGAAAAVERAERRAWLPAALLGGGAWGLQVLNGDPVCELMTGVAVLLLGLATAARRPLGRLRAARAARLLVVLGFALAVSAVQLLPAAQRLAASSRARGLAAPRAADWSLPPARLGEVVFPRLFGDPARSKEGLYFGGGLDPRGEPYVASLYPGLLLAVVGLGALLSGAGGAPGSAPLSAPVPRLPLRAVWAGGAAVGFWLALGRHNPLNAPLLALLPAFAVQRFAEKYAVLGVACLVFAGALGWQRLLAAAGPARRRASALPWALALAVCAVAAAALALLGARPGAMIDLLRRSALSVPPELALAALRREARTALALALAVAALLTALRRGWLAPPALSRLAVALLAADLWMYGHGLAAIVPAAEYAAAPVLAARLPAGEPIFVDPAASRGPRVMQAGVPPEVAALRSQLSSLLPYTPVLWGIPYALNPDYDVTATRWSQLAIGAMEADRRTAPQLVLRQAGAWGAATVLVRKPDAAWLRELAVDGSAPPLAALADPFYLPRLRFVPRVTVHGSYREALAAARAEGYDVGRSEHRWQAGGAARVESYAADAMLVPQADSGGRLRLRYRAGGPGFLVVATTFDPGWHAIVDGQDDGRVGRGGGQAGGRALPLVPTALCQLAVAVPAGDHRLELAYREPLLPAGAAVSLLALVAGAAALVWCRRAAAPELQPSQSQK